MSVKIFGKALLVALSVTFASHIVYNYCRQKKKRTEVNEVLMFAPGSEELAKSKYTKSMVTKNIDRLLHYISSSRYSLDICMYVLTNMDVGYAILKLNYRGVKIRVIVDADMAFSNGSFIRKLEKQGIPVRWMKSPYLMHHKFCLVDAMADNSLATPLLMLGSLNWTNQALRGNWEDLIITSNDELVDQFKLEFERLWNSFKPVVDI